jgi:hypothetical protein
MKAAARGSLARVQASGNALSSEIATTPVNPRAITPDLDNDEDQAVLKAVGDSKREARGSIAVAWNKANSDLNGTASDNATAFVTSAAELGTKVNEKIPEAEQTIRDGGEATVGLIDSMARSQLGAIDSAERQTLAAIEHAKGQAGNILTAGKVAVARLRADAFRRAGYKASVRQSSRGSGLARIVEIQGHKEISQIQVHPGGGRHGGAYVKISTNHGTLKVVDSSTYEPTPGERANIVDKDDLP